MKVTPLLKLMPAPACLLLLACGGSHQEVEADSSAIGQTGAQPSSSAASAVPNADEQQPVDAFMARIAEHCGQAFAGIVIADSRLEPEALDDGVSRVMHVRECGEDELRIPFHIGDDHSRTWILTRTAEGLRLKHDHRLEDGSEDVVTMYGGDTAEAGSALRQEFPIDRDSVELYVREGINASTGNIWEMEIEPAERFSYGLVRSDGSTFRVDFDLTTPVAPPPTPWGYSELED